MYGNVCDHGALTFIFFVVINFERILLTKVSNFLDGSSSDVMLLSEDRKGLFTGLTSVEALNIIWKKKEFYYIMFSFLVTVDMLRWKHYLGNILHRIPVSLQTYICNINVQIFNLFYKFIVMINSEHISVTLNFHIHDSF